MGGLRTFHTCYNVSSSVLPNGDVNTSKSHQGMDLSYCQRGLYSKGGESNIYLLKKEIKNLHFYSLWWGSQKLKILKSSETSKSAFFSFVGVQHISFDNRDKKNIPYLLQCVKLCIIQWRCQHFKVLPRDGPKSLSERFI